MLEIVGEAKPKLVLAADKAFWEAVEKVPMLSTVAVIFKEPVPSLTILASSARGNWVVSDEV